MRKCTAFFKKPHSFSNNSGFTLIELILVIFIISLISSVSFTAISRFNQSQNLNNAYEDMKNDIYYARSSALSQTLKKCKSDDITTRVFNGYSFSWNSNSYSIIEECSPDLGGDRVVKSKTLSGVTLTSNSPGPISFKALDGGTTGLVVDPVIITLRNGTRQKQIKIYKSGVIEGIR